MSKVDFGEMSPSGDPTCLKQRKDSLREDNTPLRCYIPPGPFKSGGAIRIPDIIVSIFGGKIGPAMTCHQTVTRLTTKSAQFNIVGILQKACVLNNT